MIEPTTSDIKGLLNTEKIHNNDEEDNELFDDIDDLIDNNNNNEDNDNNDNDNDNDEDEDEDEDNDDDDDNDTEIKTNYNQFKSSDFKEILQNGGYDELTPQQQKLAKYDLLCKLSELVKQNGLQITTDYNMNSPYEDIKMEYDYHINVRAKKRTISTIYSGLICGAKGIEFLNKKFNPFGINIDGFTINLEASREELLDTLTELYEKYFVETGKELTPESRLILIFIKALISTIITNMASSYISSLFDNSKFSKENIKQQLKQNQQNQNQQQDKQQIFNRSSDVMNEFNKEADLRNIKLSPMPDFD